jgi:putative ABC transport system permease protein
MSDDVSAGDPFTFAGVSLLLFSIMFVAGYIPAHRAAKIDPIQALHHE